MEAVVKDEVDKAIIPIENCISGPSWEAYSGLANHPDLFIVKELALDVDHCLLALSGARISNIKRVYGDKQAISQCSEYLGSLGVEVVPHNDLAGATASIRSGKHVDVAIIASRRAAFVYALAILRESIQNSAENVTRFVAVSKEQWPSPEPQLVDPEECKTTVMVGLHPGQHLTAILSTFDASGIQVDHVQSSPVPVRDSGACFTRVYFVDLIGTLAEPLCKLAVQRTRQSAGFVKALGSYRRHFCFMSTV